MCTKLQYASSSSLILLNFEYLFTFCLVDADILSLSDGVLMESNLTFNSSEVNGVVYKIVDGIDTAKEAETLHESISHWLKRLTLLL